MSFKNDYKSKMENIRTDNYIRQKVLDRLDAKEQKQAKKGSKVFFRSMIAFACLCLAVAVAIPTSVILKNRVKTTPKSQTLEKHFVSNAASYAEIYEKVKELKKEGFFLYDSEGDVDTMAKAESDTLVDGSAPTDDTATDMGGDAGESNDRYSETNNQVAGVDEADVVKTDGKYIYALSTINRKLRIIKAGKEPEVVSETYLKNQNYWSQNMFLYNDKLVIFSTEYDNGLVYSSEYVSVLIYDISDPAAPVLSKEIQQDGAYFNSRLIGDKLYLISEYYVNNNIIVPENPETYVPKICFDDENTVVPADSIYINSVCKSAGYTVICAYNVNDGTLCSTQSFLGGAYALYSNTKNMIVAGFAHNNETEITRLTIDDGKIELKAQGVLKGGLLNQFSIDEFGGYFRFVTTDTTVKETRDDMSVSATLETTNALYVFDGDLKQVGTVENIAPDERVYSVRFMGDTAYFVTFRQVDPLFTVDLSDPYNPKIIGALKIPGFSSYMHPYGEGLLLGIGQDADETTGRAGDVKLSMFNISDPAKVTEQSKLIINAYYSDALDDHKAVLIDTKLNIIGFIGYDDYCPKYFVYAYENGEFVTKATISLSDFKCEKTRGLFIGDELYIVTQDRVIVCDLNTFETIFTLYL